MNWDLEYAVNRVIDKESKNTNVNRGGYRKIVPDTYSVSLSKEINGVITELAGPVEFKVVPLKDGTLKGAAYDEVAAFWKEIDDFNAQMSETRLELRNAKKEVKAMGLALSRTSENTADLAADINQVSKDLAALEIMISGSPSKNEIGEKNSPTINTRIRAAQGAVSYSSYGPTQTAKESLEIAKKEYAQLEKQLEVIVNTTIPGLKSKLEAAGAPPVR